MNITDRYLPEKNYSIMLDSGAFTAWTRKVDIDINDYIEFLHKYEPYLESYVNLDKIPAEYGRKATSEEVKSSARISFENFLYMRDNGLDPIPVFHYGEDFEWLEKMIDVGCEYIGISPTTDKTTAQKRAWLDKVFDFITDDQGRPFIKTHGFGVAALPLLVRYPWYTADSTSWVRISSFGNIIIPKLDVSGNYDYTKIPTLICVSDGSSNISKANDHYKTSSPVLRRAVDNYLEEIGLGYDYEALSKHYSPRDEVILRYFAEVEKSMPAKAFDRSLMQPNFFAPKRKYERKGSLMKVRLIYACTPEPRRYISLTNCGAKTRLISYYYHEDGSMKEDYIPRVAKHGVGDHFSKLHRIKLRGNAI
ncbi:MAG: hypothetical protein KAR06_00390 [Deltaproteobacteria bacterium]|nr:hypothetical protein [Deltaproteobacteria bacterium]